MIAAPVQFLQTLYIIHWVLPNRYLVPGTSLCTFLVCVSTRRRLAISPVPFMLGIDCSKTSKCNSRRRRRQYVLAHARGALACAGQNVQTHEKLMYRVTLHGFVIERLWFKQETLAKRERFTNSQGRAHTDTHKLWQANVGDSNCHLRSRKYTVSACSGPHVQLRGDSGEN